MTKMPVVFSGHGSPMLALADDEITHGMVEVAASILTKFGKPKAILAISAHWFEGGTFIQSAEEPRQVFDMFGFPVELYDVNYLPSGCADLTARVQELLGDRVSVNDDWGIDHGTWTVLVHMFPDASVPVVQLSVDSTKDPAELVEIGRALAPLRDEGYLIFASGNIVHNLWQVEWSNPNGTAQARRFNRLVVDAVRAGDAAKLADYQSLPDAGYAVPTPDHYLPLLYCVGAADGEVPEIFNNACNLGSMAMTGFTWGL